MHDAAILTGGIAPAHEPGAYPSLSCCGGPVVLVEDGLLHCDLCDKTECADDLTPDWNGETGCHLSCEGVLV